MTGQTGPDRVADYPVLTRSDPKKIIRWHNTVLSGVFPGVFEFRIMDVSQRVWRTGKPGHHPLSQYKDERIANWRENYIYRLPSGEVVTIYDVTERKRAEEAIQKSRQKWLTTFNAIADAVFLFDEKGRIIQHKHAFETFSGKPTDEIDGRYCYDVMHGTTYPFDGCPYMKARISRQRESLELKFADRWFVATVDPVLSDNDEISGGVHLLIDIWERKLVEEACDR